MTQEELNEMLEEDAIIDASHDDYDDLVKGFFRHIEERTNEYTDIFERAADSPDSKFLIGDKAMAIVRAQGLVTSLGSPIRPGDQLAGIVVDGHLFDNDLPEAYYLVFNEQELAEIGEVVDTVMVDFIEPIGHMHWGTGYIFYDETYSFISYSEKYYDLLENSSNPNRSFNILHYM